MLNHLAIIMDGNGRWAKARHLPRTAGHKEGAETARKAIKSCKELGIKYLTLYTFSSENWSRPADEVKDLMNLLKYYLGRELKDLHKNGIKLKVIGDISKLSKDIRDKIAEAEKLTYGNTAAQLNMALSYGSRQEITYTVKKIAEKIQQEKLKIDEINENIISDYLYTSEIPDPDLLIRTGGEHRLSNFLLWQSAYTELYFTDVLWPDFEEKELKEAIADFETRERRFGNTKS